ncbi:hypothetical protein ACWEJ6_47685 [Nonomuraea sp. NPDC004702]
MSARTSALLIVWMAGMTACSPSPLVQDRTPIGAVTASPRECGLLSDQAIKRATGLTHFYASGTNSSTRFQYCVVSESANAESPKWLEVTLDPYLAFSREGLERRRVIDKGVALPVGVGPGFSAAIKTKDGEPLGAFVSAWATQGTKLLSITLYRGAPGRDHQADVIEFARQLRPILLTQTP